MKNDGRKDEERLAEAARRDEGSNNGAPRDVQAARGAAEAKGNYGEGSHDLAELEEVEGGREARPAPSAIRSGEPDVLLDVPQLDVDEITLNVSELRARVALHAAVGNLVALDVGADVSVERVELAIKGVHAQALLKVHLDRVYDVLARTLTTIDRNPELLDHIFKPVGEAVGAVSRTIEKTVPEVGKAVSTTVEETVPELGRTVGTTVGETVPRVADSARTAVDRAVPEVGVPVRKVVEENVRGAAPTVPVRGVAGETAVDVASTTHESPATAATVAETVEEAAPAAAGAAPTLTDGRGKLGRRMRSAFTSSARRVAAASALLRRRAALRRRSPTRE